jgi:hypothetical protein
MAIKQLVVATIFFAGVSHSEAQSRFDAKAAAARNQSVLQGMGFGVPSLAGERPTPKAYGSYGLGTETRTTVGTETGTTVGTKTGTTIDGHLQ